MPIAPDAPVFENIEVTLTSSASGYHYLAARLNGEPATKANLLKVPTVSPARCGHINRVCADCIDTWHDYTFELTRTVAGRRLIEVLNNKEGKP